MSRPICTLCVRLSPLRSHPAGTIGSSYGSGHVMQGRACVNGKQFVWMAMVLLGLAACGDQQASEPKTEGTIQKAPTEINPRPQTGTGGESQSNPQPSPNEAAPPAKTQ